MFIYIYIVHAAARAQPGGAAHDALLIGCWSKENMGLLAEGPGGGRAAGPGGAHALAIIGHRQ